MRIVYFQHEAELNSELSWSCWILSSLKYTYSDEFISHFASTHLYFFTDNTMICLEDSWSCDKMKIEYVSCFYQIAKHRAHRKRSVTVATSKALLLVYYQGRYFDGSIYLHQSFSLTCTRVELQNCTPGIVF